MSNLQVDNVSFSYPDGQQALDDVSLSIGKAESVAIIGQNGAGKTTLVKLLNGLLKPTAGEVIINGVNTKTKTTAQISLNVGYVFQNPDDQIFHSKVFNEIAFAPKVSELDASRLHHLVEWAAKLSGVFDFLDENPYNLPFSTRKFVSIASVLAVMPDVLILDEPTAGQDLLGIDLLRNIIKTYNEMGKTIITITHDMEFVAENFPRTIVMANRKIIDDDKTVNVFCKDNILAEAGLCKPCVTKVANYLGLPNSVLTIEDFLETIKSIYKNKI